MYGMPKKRNDSEETTSNKILGSCNDQWLTEIPVPKEGVDIRVTEMVLSERGVSETILHERR